MDLQMAEKSVWTDLQRAGWTAEWTAEWTAGLRVGLRAGRKAERKVKQDLSSPDFLFLYMLWQQRYLLLLTNKY
jgi:hypothetical protein